MESRFRVYITFGILIVLLFGLYYFTGWFSRTTGYVLGEDEKLALVQCLNNKGSVLFISSTCPDCQTQISLFGNDAARSLNVYTCQSVDDCPDVNALPTWQIDGQYYPGLKSLEDLIEATRCDISQG